MKNLKRSRNTKVIKNKMKLFYLKPHKAKKKNVARRPITIIIVLFMNSRRWVRRNYKRF